MTEEGNRPETPKRFSISKQDFAQNRLTVIQEEVNSLQQQYPEVLSLCLFGSLSRGKSRIDSDIDGYLFVDITKAAQKKGTHPDQIQESQVTNTGTPNTFLSPEVAKVYLIPLSDQLINRLGLNEEQINHIRIRPISKEIIDQHLVYLTKQVQAVENYRQAVAEWETKDSTWRNKNWLDYPKHPPSPFASSNLYALFHLQVGKGIEEYREYVLNRLEEQGQLGEKVWKAIMESTELMEQYPRTNTEIYYPRSLEQARKIYSRSPLHVLS